MSRVGEIAFGREFATYSDMLQKAADAVNHVYPDAPDDRKMLLVGAVIQAMATTVAAASSEISGELVADAIRRKEIG